MSFVKGLRGWFQRFAGLFRRSRRDAEFAAELESHLQLHIEENLHRGMTAEAARREALMKLGGVEQTKETFRFAVAAFACPLPAWRASRVDPITALRYE